MTDTTGSISPTQLYRLGLVSYLNVQPMIWSLKKNRIPGIAPQSVLLESMVPRQLADYLYHGKVDTAIVPVFEGFRHPDSYYYLPGTAIAAKNPVKSVLLYSSCPLEDLQKVYLDSSSLTSIHLCKVILAEQGVSAAYDDTPREAVPYPLPEKSGWVVIGDPAMEEIGRHPYMYDLAELWQKMTGLPFVFAAWLVPKSVSIPGLSELILQSTLDGLANLEKVAQDVAQEFCVAPDFAFDYFQNHIHYLLGEKELEGWKMFGKLCKKHNLISRIPELIPYPHG